MAINLLKKVTLMKKAPKKETSILSTNEDVVKKEKTLPNDASSTTELVREDAVMEAAMTLAVVQADEAALVGVIAIEDVVDEPSVAEEAKEESATAETMRGAVEEVAPVKVIPETTAVTIAVEEPPVSPAQETIEEEDESVEASTAITHVPIEVVEAEPLVEEAAPTTEAEKVIEAESVGKAATISKEQEVRCKAEAVAARAEAAAKEAKEAAIRKSEAAFLQAEEEYAKILEATMATLEARKQQAIVKANNEKLKELNNATIARRKVVAKVQLGLSKAEQKAAERRAAAGESQALQGLVSYAADTKSNDRTPSGEGEAGS